MQKLMCGIVVGLAVALAVSPAFAASLYLADAVDGRYVAWMDQNPATPAIDIYYDFRPTVNGISNAITPEQQSVAAQALGLWSNTANLMFTRNELAPLESMINIGVGPIDGPWQTIGSGGASFHLSRDLGVHPISHGVALLDLEQWDVLIGNGNPAGTVDFFTVATHEIGHALGLGHTDTLPDIDLMDSIYHGELTQLSKNDTALIQSLYGISSIVHPLGGLTATNGNGHVVVGSLIMTPEPSGAVLLASGLLALGLMRIYRRTFLDPSPEKTRPRNSSSLPAGREQTT